MSPELETRFRREARAIARLRHQNLVQLHDFGVSADGRPYYAMELLEGETLERYLDRERGMDWREAARIGIETCSALEAAHEAGLVHRDIKPGNLFLMRDGKVKLLDFGVVQVAPEDEVGDPEALRLIGTAEYMAPEQAAGETVDARADLYALGAVLYELLTGRQPHVAPTTIALIDRKLRGGPESPRERAPGRGIPKAIDRVVQKALARFSTQRYASAAEMRTALEAALAAPSRERTLRRRAASLALLTAALAMGAVAVKSSRNPEVRARAATLFRPTLVKLGAHPASVEAPGAAAAAGDADPAVAVLYELPKPAGETTAPGAPPALHEEGTENDGEVEESAPSAKPATDPAASDGTTEDSDVAKAEAYSKRGQYLYALTVYRKIGRTRGSDPRVLRGWSEAAVKTKGWGEALRVAIQWASSDSSPEAQLYLARIQHSAGQRYGALETLTRLVERHPDLREAADLLDRYSEKKLAAR